MYHPYFRGKQFELLCIREMAPILKQADFRPIVEPVRDNLSPETTIYSDRSASTALTLAARAAGTAAAITAAANIVKAEATKASAPG